MSDALVLDASDLDATRRIGVGLGAALRPGYVVALIGPLGSGKTTLVKAVAEGAGVADQRQVNSPTFVIVNEYEGTAGPPIELPLRIYHIDAYRLRGGADLEALGFDEMCANGAVLIEWADRVADVLPDDHLTVTIEPTGDTQRRFRCSAGGPDSRALLPALEVPCDPPNAEP